jgi:ectoine hydroxylase-related dioxygenase (phytanoyl-CoA dioxygenase family)
MPWNILESLWKRTQQPTTSNVQEENTTWNQELETLYSQGVGMEETLRYLYFDRPDFATFKNWIISKKKNALPLQEELDTPVLSAEDLAFWDQNGYVIIKEAISKQDCEDTQKAIWDFLQMNPEEKETWYKKHEEQRGMMLTFSDHETLNRNRLSPKIKKAYEQLYGTNKIYKIIDKVSFNPPETDHYRFRGSKLHWDVSLKPPIPFELQGLLYLTDCGPDDGAFHCVPGFHNHIESWLNNLAEGENPREKALETLQPIPILGNAGDFIIWHKALPHCATPNHGQSPRMVQYLTYLPEGFKASEEWI